MRCSCGQKNSISTTECPRCEKALLLGMDPVRLLIDVGAAVVLLISVGLVFLIDRGRVKSGVAGDSQDEPKVTVEHVDDKAPAVEAEPMRIAVTPPEYDDMGKLLDTLGSGYRYSTIQYGDLLSSRRLAEYDVVFVTCGYVPKDWASRRLRDAGRDGGGYSAVKPKIAKRLTENIRAYVAGGGTLYLSDWLFDLLVVVFPELIDKPKVGSGAAQTVRADVVDAGLRRSLGRKTIELRFDKPAWRPAALAGPRVDTLLSGTYQLGDGRKVTGPLLVQFPWQGGNVIFTSFHNEKQNSEVELQLLRYLVFTTVTARTDARIKKTLVHGGFSPVDRSLLAASPKDQSVTRTYENLAACHLQFVLGFKGRAELKLSVAGPDGDRQEKTARSTFTLDFPKAAKGPWKYTATPVNVPYENFPFTLTVGEKP